MSTISSKEFLEITFFIITVIFSIMVITLANPMYSVLALIAMFISIAVGLMLVGADLFAFILILVYVGAVMVLFMVTIMTVPVKHNILMHFRVVFALFFVVFCGVLIGLEAFAGDFIRVSTISSDSLLFSSFIKALQQTCHITFLSNFGLTQVVPGDVFYNIYLIFSAQRFIFASPADSSTLFFFYLYQNFINYILTVNLLDGNQHLLHVFGDALFEDSLLQVFGKSYFISLSAVVNDGSLDQILLIPATHSAFDLYYIHNMFLPDFLALQKFIFVSPEYSSFFVLQYKYLSTATLVESTLEQVSELPYLDLVSSHHKKIYVSYKIFESFFWLHTFDFYPVFFYPTDEGEFYDNLHTIWHSRTYGVPRDPQDWVGAVKAIHLRYTVDNDLLIDFLRTIEEPYNWINIVCEDSRIGIYKISQVLYNGYGVALAITGLILLGSLVSFTMYIDWRIKRLNFFYPKEGTWFKKLKLHYKYTHDPR